MTARETFAAKLRATLAEADNAFAETADPMDALGWIALAAKAGAALPPHMGAWLHQALQTYICGDGTMDAAMGLDKRGQGQPRRKRRETSALNGVHAKMWFLVGAGASRTEAAELVSTTTGRSVEQLLRTYSKSWFARRADRPFDGMDAPQARRYLAETLLPEFPDDARTRKTKARILARFQPPSGHDGTQRRVGGGGNEDPDPAAAS